MEKSPSSPTQTAHCAPTPLLPLQMGTDKNKPLKRVHGIFLRIPRAVVSPPQPASKDQAGAARAVLWGPRTWGMPML